MARGRYLCGSFCLCMWPLFFLAVYCRSEFHNEYQVYLTDYPPHRFERFLDLELLKDDAGRRHHQKRDVEMESPHLAKVTSSPINGSGTAPPPTKPSKPSKSKPVDSPDSTNFVTKGKSVHNLGVNGTGQWKNVTVVKQLPPLIRNVSSTVNTPANNASYLQTPESFDPEGLTPEEVEVGDEKDLKGNNITAIKTDTHVFYNSTTYNDPEIGKSFWVNMENRSDVKVNELLSSSHRRAATIKLSFQFPFYGHFIKNVTIATGGFLYTGNYVHSWLAATQYVAPLMANFDTSLSNNSFIKFVDNGTAFTTEWERVVLQDKPKNGEFTFQVTLHKNGDIVFVYKNVPLLIKDIEDVQHPVKVGLSDAYIMDRTIYLVRKKTIYEYHRVAFKREEIKNWTAIYLKALPTCLDFHDCASCLGSDIQLECKWCPKTNYCSTGYDRHRQSWVDKDCEKRNVSQQDRCGEIVYDKTDHEANTLNYNVVDPLKSFDGDYLGTVPRQSGMGASGSFAIVFLILMIFGLGTWTVYAYRNPHTTSGQILIRYRPSQWRWRRGEARYTAATIHM